MPRNIMQLYLRWGTGNLLLAIVCLAVFSWKRKPETKKPNIVIIVADDLGYSDLGCYGSEIATPHLDDLARHGQIFTNFYTAATCSPSRAMLLSGTDNHIAGLGDMAERVPSIPAEIHQRGYEGYLNNRVVSVAALLKEAGYHTYMAGKWHLGTEPEHSPTAHGFERSFALLDGYANHFVPDNNTSYWEDGQYTSYPKGEYSTNVYTDKMIGYLEKGKHSKQPFFLFAAYTSPHWPLQAPPEFIAKYSGKYDIGYDSLRILRFQGLKQKDLVAGDIGLPPLPAVKGNLYNISTRPLLPWIALNTGSQQIEARKMEIYAAMVENLDYNIGRLIDQLRKIGEYDNTFFVFISDNGPAVLEANETPDKTDPLPFMGSANSFVAYGPAWAHASSAVNRLYKGYSSEGGIHSPMIVKMPGQNTGNGIINAFITIKDLAPTFLDLAGRTYPGLLKGRKLAPYQGASILPMLLKQKAYVHGDDYVMGWELFGRCAIRKGKWKITKIEAPLGKGVFELVDLEADPAETTDVSKRYPDKYRELLNDWDDYIKNNGVILSK